MPIEVESLRADVPEGASGTSAAPGDYFSGALHGRPRIDANRNFSQEGSSEKTCEHAAGRSRNPLRTLQRGSNPSSRLRTSHSTRYRRGEIVRPFVPAFSSTQSLLRSPGWNV